MRRALALGRSALGRTSPNPPVGCVLLDESGRVVGEGATAPAGGPHAEIVALREAGSRARGATAVVTLEPCRHVGRTGPCTRALVEAGITRVVYAVDDPDPAAGGGAGDLRAAGVAVEAGLLADEAARGALEAWLFAVRHGRVFVTWKYAATLDGRTAAPDGTSRWITGPMARAQVHQLRADSDAVLVGVGTVLADDPQLTVRGPDGEPVGRQPLRVVFDRSGRTPAGARVRDDAAPTLLTTEAPARVLASLYDRGARSALLEGGATLAGAFVAAGLVDRVVGYVAPKLLAGGPPVLAGAGIDTLAGALALDIDTVAQVGPDVRIIARPTREA
ncbi:MAG TPA: bifunctional diaminohydroxyphosphoribosylaminopyrimidine deaminase/5-amino-6-(5-phosphoribosylamino)uracil reductase RibD [Mycobacteriales bacterium]|jgi:diaminohydroxyphosphoribosylaminopyrimidine deaminase/5-amino-6-(5-phosphoribosylamino)uracil reductase